MSWTDEYKKGDRVKYINPGHREHGDIGIVSKVDFDLGRVWAHWHLSGEELHVEHAEELEKVSDRPITDYFENLFGCDWTKSPFAAANAEPKVKEEDLTTRLAISHLKANGYTVTKEQ